jgi:hypothetical protein
VEWPIPPQRTNVLVREGRAWRARNTVSAPWRTADTQITMQSVVGQDGEEMLSCEQARKPATRLISEALCTEVILSTDTELYSLSLSATKFTTCSCGFQFHWEKKLYSAKLLVT